MLLQKSTQSTECHLAGVDPLGGWHVRLVEDFVRKGEELIATPPFDADSVWADEGDMGYLLRP